LARAYGYEWVPETGLYHVGARVYDPRTARWLQRDPIDADSGDPNLYRYCGNDPVSSWDDGGEQQAKKQPSQGKQAADRASEGIPSGAEICPKCEGTGIVCDGLHQTTRQLRFLGFTIMVSESEWFIYCGECNGLGYLQAILDRSVALRSYMDSPWV